LDCIPWRTDQITGDRGEPIQVLCDEGHAPQLGRRGPIRCFVGRPNELNQKLSAPKEHRGAARAPAAEKPRASSDQPKRFQLLLGLGRRLADENDVVDLEGAVGMP
jgi:hypothetical protein